MNLRVVDNKYLMNIGVMNKIYLIDMGIENWMFMKLAFGNRKSLAML